VEASALPASVGLARARLGLGAPLLRLRSDEQLVSLFRAGNEDAFRVIHDRYRARMHAYTRQMLSGTSADAEDAVQEIFVRAYSGLRTNRRELALRAWLYRIAHNRCIDELRKPRPITVDAIDELGEASTGDPAAAVEQREVLRRLIADVQRLPEQQRSALLMRELGGMPYADLSGALGVTVPAVKSLLVRARVGLAQANEARDTACAEIRDDLIGAHDRGVRASGLARRHLRDCPQCRAFRGEVQGVSRNLGLLVPALGPLAVAAKLLGLGGLSASLGGGSSAAAGSGATAAAGTSAAAAAGTSAAAAGTGAAAAGTGAAATGAAAAATGAAAAGTGAAAAGTGAAAAAGTTAAVGATAVGTSAAVGSSAVAGGGVLAAAGAGHVATILAATVVAAGGAIGIQHEVSGSHHHRASRPAAHVVLHHHAAAAAAAAPATAPAGAPATATPIASVSEAPSSTPGAGAAQTGDTPSTGATPRHAPLLSPTSHEIAAPDSAGFPAQPPATVADPTTVSTPVTTPAPTTTDPTATDPTSTDPTSTSTDPTSTDPTSTSTDPTSTSTDPTSTDPTSATPQPASTTPTMTIPVVVVGPASTAPTAMSPTPSPTPIAGAAPSNPTRAGNPTKRHGNPGTATGVVPPVTSASTSTGSGGTGFKVRVKARKNVKRGAPASVQTVVR
jgi:RNA polymerase sigma factor (sigma-70 family)